MQVPDTVRLEVRVTHAYSEDSDYRRGDPEAFWQPLIQRRDMPLSRGLRQGEPAIPTLESKLAAALPRHLRQALSRYFSPQSLRFSGHLEEPISDSTLGARSASLVPLVGLSVASIRYGSLDLSIEFTGVKHLVELFDSNFDLFMMFAQAYLPVAFADAMLEMEMTKSDFEFQMVPTPKLVSAFASSSVLPKPISGPPVAATSTPSIASINSDRMKATWQIVNFTLLVPVALALLVFYIAAKSVADERNELREWHKELSAREQASARSANERLIQLEKVQSELIILLRNPQENKN